MSVQRDSALAFDLGAGAKRSIMNSVENTAKQDAPSTSNANERKTTKKGPSASKPGKGKGAEEEIVRFQAFMPKSLKRRLKLYAASEDMTATQAMDMLLSDALARRGA